MWAPIRCIRRRGDRNPHWLLSFTALFSRSDSPTSARQRVHPCRRDTHSVEVGTTDRRGTPKKMECWCQPVPSFRRAAKSASRRAGRGVKTTETPVRVKRCSAGATHHPCPPALPHLEHVLRPGQRGIRGRLTSSTRTLPCSSISRRASASTSPSSSSNSAVRQQRCRAEMELGDIGRRLLAP